MHLDQLFKLPEPRRVKPARPNPSPLIEERIKKAWRSTFALKAIWKPKDTVWSMRQISALATQCVLPVLTFGMVAATAKELERLDGEYLRIRRTMLGIPMMQEKPTDGGNRWRATSAQAILMGGSRPSTQIRCQRAKLLGHALRHPTPLQLLMMREDRVAPFTDEKHYPAMFFGDHPIPQSSVTHGRSIIDRIARDLGLTRESLLESSSRRDAWADKVQQLRDTLNGWRNVTLCSEPRWKQKVKQWKKLPMADLQFLEEGKLPFLSPLASDDTLHVYTDASIKAGAHAEVGAAGMVIVSAAGIIKGKSGWSLPHCRINKAEAEAVAAAVDALGDQPGVIHTDSLQAWIWWHHLRRGCRYRDWGALEDTIDTWRHIDKTLINRERANIPTYLIKVHGHVGNEFNEAADRMAREAAAHKLRSLGTCRVTKPYSSSDVAHAFGPSLFSTATSCEEWSSASANACAQASLARCT
jgi:ribonuclease HI